MKNLKTFCLSILSTLALTLNYAQTTFKLPIPSQAEALAKVKSSESLKERLNEIGLSQADIQISLKEHEAYIPQSDEICYQIYRDSKKIEGSNYIYVYTITTKPNKFGEKFSSLAYVYYTRIDITKTTCNIKNQWEFEYVGVDGFKNNSANGLISVKDAENAIWDTIKKGFSLDEFYSSSKDLTSIYSRVFETCRIDELKTCEFGKSDCSTYYQVKNEMWEQTHIICFETTIYRGEYETGPALFGSMYRVLKYKSLIYCEFKRINGKVKLTTIYVSDKDNSEEIPESSIQDRPLDVYYVPISKTSIDEIKMKFKTGTPENISILNHVSFFKGMAADLEANIGKDYNKNLEVLKKYMIESAAEKSALEFSNEYSDGYKYSNWSETLIDDNFRLVLKCEKRLKKNPPTELKTNIHYLQVELINGKYYLKHELNL